MAKTQDDWFLRGGERSPADTENSCSDGFVCQNCGNCWPADVGETCPSCGASISGRTSTAEYCGADGDGDGKDALRSFNVTVVREKTVEQTHVMTVAARDEDDALDVARKRLDSLGPDVIDGWDWKDDGDTAEYGDPDPVETEEIP